MDRLPVNFILSHILFFLFFTLISYLTVAAGQSVMVKVPQVTGCPGRSIEIPFILERPPMVAGIKFVVVYDDSLLKYKGFHKSKAASSMIHVVNSKVPGRLVIAMASARGVSGDKVEVFRLIFFVTSKIPPARFKSGIARTTLKIPEAELMSQGLESLKPEIHISPVLIKEYPPEKKQGG